MVPGNTISVIVRGANNWWLLVVCYWLTICELCLPTGTSFLQIRSKLTTGGHRDTTEVFNFLTKRSVKLHSDNLAMLVTKMGDGPFDKVRVWGVYS